ncbi:MAG TPA: hypothetical protein PL017_01015 [Tenuifilaceae bacterium]|nr:hypothetical protein [Tenuifilaceae bacterium]HPE17067.1 hypothetical protein [Tenuifilaceae bacterium]HPJ44648.1 hypothetical protein [Tenuifilaceae bacterium]HPQ32911.1 hypothetical protein [Tenuifilaceae bacterium]HRX66729.1 hypothetical protein [Tenuifilaceae bacterium]
MITRENYEVFIIDYLDGNLNPGLAEELHRFLQLNPDLAEEFEGLSSVSLTPKNIEFEGKELLKKKSFSRHGIESETTYLLIAEHEGDISEEEKFQLSKLLNENPSLQNDRIIFSKTKLVANPNEKFEYKMKFKRTPVIKLKQHSLRFALSIAASLLIFVGLFALVNTRLVTNQNFIVQSQEQKPQKEKPETEHLKNNEHQEVLLVNQEFEKKIAEEKPESLHKKETVDGGDIRFMSTPQEQTEAPFSKEAVVLKRVEPIDLQKVTLTQTKSTIEIAIPRTSNTMVHHAELSQKAKNTLSKGSLKDVGLFDIVQLGVNKFSQATGTNLKLEGERNREGKLVKVEFNSKLFALSTPVRKK